MEIEHKNQNLSDVLSRFPQNPAIQEMVFKTLDHIEIRAMAYSTCFSEATDKKIAQFRPLFFLTDSDKQQYKDFCGVIYSDCYEVYGFNRTGCCCCPFGSGFERELEVVKKYEPKLYAAVCKIFGPSYEYTRKYRKFKEALKREELRQGQISLFDDPYEMIGGEMDAESEAADGDHVPAVVEGAGEADV